MNALKILLQAFFDLKARILPGLTLFFLLAWCDSRVWDEVAAVAEKVIGRAPPPIWALFIAAYIVGHLLSPAAKLVQWIGERFPRALAKSDLRRFEWLRTNQPEAGGHCAKLRGEFTLYNSFAAIFLVFSAVWPIRHYNDTPVSEVVSWAVGLFTLGVLLAWRGRVTQDTMRKSVDSFYLAADGPENA